MPRDLADVVATAWRLPLGVAVAALVVLATLSFRDYARLDRETVAIARSEQLSAAIDRLIARLVDAEAGQRGYVITARREFLAPYTSVDADARQALATVTALAGSEAARRADVERLAALVDEKLREMAAVLDIARAGDSAGASARVAEGQGKRVMDAIRDLGAGMKAAEQGALEVRSAQAAAAVRSARAYGLASVVVAALLAAVGWTVTRTVDLRQRALTTESVARLEAERDAAATALVLEQSESVTRSLLDSSGDGIAVIGAGGEVVTMNRAGVVALALDPQQPWRPRPWRTLWGEAGDDADAALHAALLGDEGRFTARRDAGGDARWWDVKLTPVRRAGGAPDRVVAIARDVTMQRRADEQRTELLSRERAARSDAERAARMKDEFVSTLSHELRTPLNAILGWVGVLRQDQSAPTLARALDVIDRNSRRQSQMIDDLLDMGRILSGKLRLDVHRVDLASVIEEALTSAEPAADAKGVRLVKILGSAAIIQGDPGRLQQVMWNLVSNAIKFTPRGGQVQATLRKVNSQVLVQISDTGVGIAPEILPHVFDRFRQGEATASRRFGGLGLGLSIVKNLVELHGGSVEVASDGENLGSVFTVRLPLALARARSDGTLDRQDAVAVPVPLLAGVRVLVVDDEEDARDVVARLLEDAGARVAAAATVEDALAWLGRESPPDVIVSDVGMPGRDGYDFIQAVRRLPGQAAETPAAALTALARLEDRRRALLAGFQTHLAKPVDPSELVATVATLTRRTGRA